MTDETGTRVPTRTDGPDEGAVRDETSTLWRTPEERFAWRLMNEGEPEENLAVIARMVEVVKAARPFAHQLDRWYPGCDDDTKAYVFAEGDDPDADFAIEKHRREGYWAAYRLGHIRQLAETLTLADQALAQRNELVEASDD